MVIKFQFVEQNSVECPSDLGANLVQHFIGRYSRCSRYRTKSHDKATISNDITRYSRYQTVLSKLEEIITAQRQLFRYTKKLCYAGLFVLQTGGREACACKRGGVLCKKRFPLYKLANICYNDIDQGFDQSI